MTDEREENEPDNYEPDNYNPNVVFKTEIPLLTLTKVSTGEEKKNPTNPTKDKLKPWIKLRNLKMFQKKHRSMSTLTVIT